MGRRTLIAILGFLILTGVDGGVARADRQEGTGDSYLLEVDGRSRAEVAALVAAAGGTLLRWHPEIGFALALSREPGFAAAATDAGLADVAPNRRLPAAGGLLAASDVSLRTVSLPASRRGASPAMLDPTATFFYGCQWGLHRIDAAGAWAQGAFGDPDVRVALLSTGIDHEHQELAGKIDLDDGAIFLTPGTSSCPEVPDETTLRDFASLGTAIASMLVGNTVAIGSVAPESRLVPVKVQACRGETTVADVVAGVLYAASLQDVEVIYTSVSFLLADTPANRPLIKAMRAAALHAHRRGKLLVSGAGDDGLDLTQSPGFTVIPAVLPTVLPVYAVARAEDEPLGTNSNFGFPRVRVGAPAGQVPPNPGPPLVDCPLPEFFWGGTFSACSRDVVDFFCPPNAYGGIGESEVAAAHVAGVALLLDGEVDGWLPPWALRALISLSADDIGPAGIDHVFGFGRVNASRAVALLP